MRVNNETFLKVLFGARYKDVHVTSFKYDPLNIPNDEHLKAWKGDTFDKYTLKENENQYFTISLFDKDEQHIARRRKSLFQQTHVIVLDDVKEKLSLTEVKKLPSPTYILETSPGSEQWGYVLTSPETNRHTVENLLDGLVANGLAPNAKDPGMKGVTRYVRLPDGVNTKKSKMVNGKPFQCLIKKWNPFNTVTLEQLAQPFCVDLYKKRREERLDGATDIPDHPLLNVGLNIKEIRSKGRFDITCPWVEEHTKQVDSGTGIFTNEDGSLGFKCHHGHCENRTGKDLMEYLEDKKPGFTQKYNEWKFQHNMKELVNDVNETPQNEDQLLDFIKESDKSSKQCREYIKLLLKEVDQKDQMERDHYHDSIIEVMGYTKKTFKNILEDLRETWYDNKPISFYDNVVYIKEQNRFYEYSTQIFLTPDAFQNSYSHIDSDAKKQALNNGRVTKVDKIDFAPKKPRIYEQDGVTCANTWNAIRENKGQPGDCTPWLKHWDTLGWSDHKEHMLKWMAYTILHPENKINHMLLLGGMEGTGKDFLLYPLKIAMGNYYKTIDGHVLLSGFNDYLLNTAYLHINEAELGDRREALEISNKLKPLAAAPPDTLRVNQKGITPIDVQNIVNLSMTTNSQIPIKLSGASRRFYAVWSDLNVRSKNNEMLPEWLKYFSSLWDWMKKGGVNHCIYHLRNNIDLSDFKPGEAPKMTDFLRDIQESSKSPAQLTIEAFIEHEVGAFKSDLITTTTACETIRSAMFSDVDYMYQLPNWFTPVKVGRIFQDIQSCVRLRGRKNNIDKKIWAIRNVEKYKDMSMKELYDEYEKQIEVNKVITVLK